MKAKMFSSLEAENERNKPLQGWIGLLLDGLGSLDLILRLGFASCVLHHVSCYYMMYVEKLFSLYHGAIHISGLVSAKT